MWRTKNCALFYLPTCTTIIAIILFIRIQSSIEITMSNTFHLFQKWSKMNPNMYMHNNSTKVKYKFEMYKDMLDALSFYLTCLSAWTWHIKYRGFTAITHSKKNICRHSFCWVKRKEKLNWLPTQKSKKGRIKIWRRTKISKWMTLTVGRILSPAWNLDK